MLGTWQEGPGPAHQRLSDRLRLLVLDGRLSLGAALPSERDLATALGTSRTTVGAAYRTLVEHRYLATRARARATVRLPHDTPSERPSGTDSATIDLSFAAPPAPAEILHAAFADALERLPLHFERHGYDRYGTAELREAVADWYQRRGLPTAPDHIMITNGAQHALGLLARTLLAPRDKVLIDHPTYPHAIRTFTAARARLLPVAVEASGWDTAQLHAAGRAAQLAYLIPDFHNPTGMCMSASVRRRLRLACPTIIDETMTDLALDGAKPEPFAVHMPTAVSIGSVSKSIWGGLRTGWIRAVPSLLERLEQARPATDLGTPVVEQLATAVLLNERRTEPPDTLQQLRSQRDALRRALSEYLPDVHAPQPAGGVTLWAAFPEPISSRLAAIAPDYGVTIAAGPRFGIGGAFERYIRLPYTLPSSRLTEAIRRLEQAQLALAQGATGTHTPAPVA
ncbi:MULTISPECIES: PLP-dependent aminotransferase family protein [unclassified Streptomyces]|uniref:MocR-like transcription factor YczR n=1 Tax=Streptomyces sp. NBC_00500 TaxID=2975762 RepID=UPI002E81F2F8|nr:PLP-dependent aminotransferase family protein [Streptomyces sp. NBC_00589]WTI41897.1 PLP-dependent aminotransferase family protein [Streptomyces sp. NBC_00775]WUB24420.1 PLP-dependent aminotransferase family protein [Streptomyces sp. NBC_00589]